jgi:hypothetical protein
MLTHDEIDQCWKELRAIQEKWWSAFSGHIPDSTAGRTELQRLALKVGASTQSVFVDAETAYSKGRPATTSELVYNIHQALQTASMIDACQTVTRNYQITVLASIVAILGALASWGAILWAR